MIGGWWGIIPQVLPRFAMVYLDKIVEIKAILSDGSAAVFADLSPAEFMAKTKGNTLESSIYKNILRNFRIKKLKTK
jgi:hypothetical protein